MNPREILYVVEIIVFIPILFIGIFVCLRHGFKRTDGWIYIGILALLRLIGAATGIAYFSNLDNTSLLETSLICANVGLSPLLLAILGFSGRVSNNARRGPIIKPLIFRLVRLPLLVALVLFIVGGVMELSATNGSSGSSERKAAVILYVLSIVLIAALVICLAAARSVIRPGEGKLVVAAVVALPFVAVRILYTILLVFDSGNTADFSLFSTAARAVVIDAVLSVLMEVIVVIIFIIAGVLAPPPEVQAGETQAIDGRGADEGVGMKDMRNSNV